PDGASGVSAIRARPSPRAPREESGLLVPGGGTVSRGRAAPAEDASHDAEGGGLKGGGMSAQTAAGERAAAVELAQALWAQLPAPALWRGGAVPVTLESVTDALVAPLGRLLRQVERDA